MKQCLEALDKTSANLIKSLTTACKFKGEPSGSDSMASVTNHLMKKSYCRFFRLDMQVSTLPLYDLFIFLNDVEHYSFFILHRDHILFFSQMWIIDDMKRKNGHWDIVLNYLDFIVQRCFQTDQKKYHLDFNTLLLLESSSMLSLHICGVLQLQSPCSYSFQHDHLS